jgi:hypothetical protein
MTQAERFTADREAMMAELMEMGLGAVSARGALQLADIGGEVNLGFGQKLRRNIAPFAGEGNFEIVGQYTPDAR